jgi:hypothetical protein
MGFRMVDVSPFPNSHCKIVEEVVDNDDRFAVRRIAPATSQFRCGASADDRLKVAEREVEKTQSLIVFSKGRRPQQFDRPTLVLCKKPCRVCRVLVAFSAISGDHWKASYGHAVGAIRLLGTSWRERFDCWHWLHCRRCSFFRVWRRRDR